jgi:hypothetical protein
MGVMMDWARPSRRLIGYANAARGLRGLRGLTDPCCWAASVRPPWSRCAVAGVAEERSVVGKPHKTHAKEHYAKEQASRRK